MKESPTDATLAWGILQSADQGRLDEMVAQAVASTILGDGDKHDIADFIAKVVDLVQHYIANPGEIWDSLMPGPGGFYLKPEFATQLLALVGSTKDAQGKLDDITDWIIDQGWASKQEARAEQFYTCLDITHEIPGEGAIVQVLDVGTENLDDEERKYLGQLAEWKGTEYDNISHPNGDEVSPGMLLNIPPQDLTFHDSDYLSDLLRDYRR